MNRKWLRRGGIAVTIFVLICLVAFLSLDWLAKTAAEHRIKNLTGFPTAIGKLTVGLRTSSIHLQDVLIKNPPEFGGGTFLEMPELFLEYDRQALREGKLHLKVARINLEKINVVENKKGETNLDALTKHQGRENKSSRVSNPTSGKAGAAMSFDGIDFLEVSLNSVKFTSQRNPDQNLVQEFGVSREPFHNLKTDLDFQTALMVLVLKAGLSGKLDFESLFLKDPRDRSKTKHRSTQKAATTSTNPAILTTPR